MSVGGFVNLSQVGCFSFVSSLFAKFKYLTAGYSFIFNVQTLHSQEPIKH